MSATSEHERVRLGIPVFADRVDAGRRLARELERERAPATVVVGLARGGVAVAAEVARSLAAPLDVVSVRKVRHPWQPEYGLGAVAPGAGSYIRGHDGLSEEELAAAVGRAQAEAIELDRRLHASVPPLDLHGKTVLVVDDGLATGGTMIASLRWARAAGAARVVAAFPVGAAASFATVEREADALVCPYPLDPFLAVGVWYRVFAQVDDEAVVRLLEEARRARVGEEAAEDRPAASAASLPGPRARRP